MVDPSVSGNHRQIDPLLDTSTIRPSTSSFGRSRILFGSCHSQHYYLYNSQHKNESDTLPIWESMSTRNASAMIWVGDAIYGDDFVRTPLYNTTTAATTTTTWDDAFMVFIRHETIWCIITYLFSDISGFLTTHRAYDVTLDYMATP